jgi:hypothetical protein
MTQGWGEISHFSLVDALPANHSTPPLLVRGQMERAWQRSGTSAPRLFNLLLGFWLLVSTFAWPHSQAQRLNAIVCGMLAVLFAISGLYRSELRFLNGILAIWLFTSSIFVHSLRSATRWSDLAVSLGMFAASLMGRSTDSPGDSHDLSRGHAGAS